jgi:hypothetical protein
MEILTGADYVAPDDSWQFAVPLLKQVKGAK